ncbi:hypothetical protein M8J77_018809 [Diaphorina citri]|nr:hypothetical protein M8J77_018809 [Diaphorina citri]
MAMNGFLCSLLMAFYNTTDDRVCAPRSRVHGYVPAASNVHHREVALSSEVGFQNSVLTFASQFANPKTPKMETLDLERAEFVLDRTPADKKKVDLAMIWMLEQMAKLQEMAFLMDESKK